eukprot:354064-Chlamydomonas_euryale.AAC.1
MRPPCRACAPMHVHAPQLEWWLQFFPPSQVMVISYERMKSDESAVLKQRSCAPRCATCAPADRVVLGPRRLKAPEADGEIGRVQSPTWQGRVDSPASDHRRAVPVSVAPARCRLIFGVRSCEPELQGWGGQVFWRGCAFASCYGKRVRLSGSRAWQLRMGEGCSSLSPDSQCWTAAVCAPNI